VIVAEEWKMYYAYMPQLNPADSLSLFPV